VATGNDVINIVDDGDDDDDEVVLSASVSKRSSAAPNLQLIDKQIRLAELEVELAKLKCGTYSNVSFQQRQWR